MMMMMMMMDDDALMVVDVACLLLFGVGEQESLFYPQNGFGNPQRRKKACDGRFRAVCVFSPKRCLRLGTQTSFRKKDTDKSAHNPLLCVKTAQSVYILVLRSYPLPTNWSLPVRFLSGAP